jgi:hypothetical protein
MVCTASFDPTFICAECADVTIVTTAIESMATMATIRENIL